MRARRAWALSSAKRARRGAPIRTAISRKRWRAWIRISAAPKRCSGAGPDLRERRRKRRRRRAERWSAIGRGASLNGSVKENHTLTPCVAHCGGALGFGFGDGGAGTFGVGGQRDIVHDLL